jgi:hypothetical protein
MALRGWLDSLARRTSKGKGNRRRHNPLSIGFNQAASEVLEVRQLLSASSNEAAQVAWDLDQSLELHTTGDYWVDYLGRDEKWVRAAVNDAWYYITPDGAFWDAAIGEQIASLSAEYHQDPVRLHEATDPAVEQRRNAVVAYELDQALELKFTGNYWEDFLGRGEKWLYSDTERAWYFITPDGQFWNAADETLAAELSAEFYEDPSLLHAAIDPGDEPASPEQLAFELDQSLDLVFTGDYWENYLGRGEKWIRSAAERSWYFLTPEGELIRAESGDCIAVLSSTYHRYPERLHDAINPAVDAQALAALAYRTDGRLGLHFTGNYWENHLGLGEKWLWSHGEGAWHYITPDGKLHHSEGADQSVQFSWIFHESPDLLHTAADDAALTLSSENVVENRYGESVGALGLSSYPGSLEDFTFAVSDDRFMLSGNMLVLRPEHYLDFETDSQIVLDITAQHEDGYVLSESLTLSVNDAVESTTLSSDGQLRIDLSLIHWPGAAGTLSNTWTTVSIAEPELTITIGWDGEGGERHQHTSLRFDSASVAEITYVGSPHDDLLINDSAIAAHASGGEGDDRLATRGALYGNNGDDVLQGSDFLDELFGGEGDDVLLGAAGDDQLSGGAGRDTLIGNAGVDRLDGGDGDDALYGDAPDSDGGGRDDIYVSSHGEDIVHGQTEASPRSGSVQEGRDIALSLTGFHGSINFTAEYGPGNAQVSEWNAAQQQAVTDILTMLSGRFAASYPGETVTVRVNWGAIPGDEFTRSSTLAHARGERVNDIGDVFFPSPLANHLERRDLNGPEPEILVGVRAAGLYDFVDANGDPLSANAFWSFNSGGPTQYRPFRLDQQGVPQATGTRTQNDFRTVFLHEVMHGLGFEAAFEREVTVSEEPDVWKCLRELRFDCSGETTTLTKPNALAHFSDNETARWTGPLGITANGGAGPVLLRDADGNIEGHLDHRADDGAYASMVTRTNIPDGFQARVISRVEAGMLADLGWDVVSSVPAARVFGFLKQAALFGQGNTSEDIDDHTAWAVNHQWTAAEIAGAISDQIQSIQATGWHNHAEVFGLVKTAWQIADDQAIDPMDQHVNWANHQHPQSVNDAIEELLNNLNTIYTLGLPSPIETEFASHLAVASVFGHLKQSALAADGIFHEQIDNHIAWAMNHWSEATTPEHFEELLRTVLANGWQSFEETFSHMKNAYRIATGAGPEDVSLHVNWVRTQPVHAVGAEMERFARELISQYGIDFSDSVRVELPTDSRTRSAFANMKNARLVASGSEAESQHGHENWAAGQPASRVIGEIQSDAEAALEGAYRDLNYVFAYVKNAGLVAAGRAAEDLSGHVAWAATQSRIVVGRSIEEFARTTADSFGFTLNRQRAELPTSMSLAESFGHVKNAWLRSTGRAEEAMSGHIGWATKESESRVLSEVRTMLDSIAASYRGISKSRLDWTFAHLKQGRLFTEGKRNESISGHRNWALNASRSVVEGELRFELSSLRRFWDV